VQLELANETAYDDGGQYLQIVDPDAALVDPG